MLRPEATQTILMVDDDPEVLRTLEKIMKRKGYQTIPFSNPLLALETMRTRRPDLILTDLKMPEMDGIQFMQEAKKIHPSVPVVLITAYATVDTAVSAIQLGGFDHVRKPFEISRIYAVIEKALESSEGR